MYSKDDGYNDVMVLMIMMIINNMWLEQASNVLKRAEGCKIWVYERDITSFRFWTEDSRYNRILWFFLLFVYFFHL